MTIDSLSPTVPDWSREAKAAFEWAPGRALLAAIRLYQRASGVGPVDWARRRIAVVRHRFWSAVSGADIPINTRIGGGLMIPHPNGIVIHPDCAIGPNCLIFQQVTLGATSSGTPMIGGHVDIGAGAKILGGIRIGDDARVGANAVVTADVEPGATVAGIPARVIGGGAGAGAIMTATERAAPPANRAANAEGFSA